MANTTTKAKAAAAAAAAAAATPAATPAASGVPVTMPPAAPAGWAPTPAQPLHYSSPVGNARPLQGYVVPAMHASGVTVLAHARSGAYKAFAPGSGGALAVALHAWCASQGLPAQAAVVLAYLLRNVPGLYYANAPYTAPGSWQQKFASAPFAKGVAPVACCATTLHHAGVWAAYVASSPAAQAAHASVAGLPAWQPAQPEQAGEQPAQQAA